MIESQNMTQNITPDDLRPEQDMLNLAGSKVSFRDLYAREIDLPSIRGKYYLMDDVDELFILINGIFTSISEQSFRSNKALTQTREKNNALNSQITKLKAENDALVSDNQKLISENGDLQAKNAVNNNDNYAKMEQSLNIAVQKLLKQNEIIKKQNEIINQLQNNNGTILSQNV